MVALGRGRVGHSTRGKTGRNRLRRTDTWIARDGILRTVPTPLYVDVGYGGEPSTTLETYRRLAPLAPGLRVVGVEIDRARVEEAQYFAQPGRIGFALGGFDLPLPSYERATVVRAMNVLRQYDERDHGDAVARMGRSLRDGGLLLEGTSSPTGRLLTANLYRRRGARVVHDGLLLAPNLVREWYPRELQSVLPKNLIHRCGPGTILDEFFAAWEKAHEAAVRNGLGPRAAFVAAAADVSELIDRNPSTLRRGFLVVRVTA